MRFNNWLSTFCLSWLATLSLCAGATAQQMEMDADARDAEFTRLRGVARADGRARVIVGFRVPDYEALRTASSEAREPESARSADDALADAIAMVVEAELTWLDEESFDVLRNFRTVPFVALAADEDALAALQSSAGLMYVMESTPSEPELGASVPLVGGDVTKAAGATGAGAYIAILDTGILASHEMFTGKDIIQACFASGYDLLPFLGNCPNGFDEDLTSPNPAQPYSILYYGFDHGTHVAGIAAGNSPNANLFGVAPGADLIAVQVFSKVDSLIICGDKPNCCIVWPEDLLKGLEYVYDLRTQVKIASLNMSLGGGAFSQPLLCDISALPWTLAIENLRNAGIAPVAAAGNDYSCSNIGAPGCISAAITVGSTTLGDVESVFSNFNPLILDFYAPGDPIESAGAITNNQYVAKYGTSMAAPHVAGAIAVLEQTVPVATLDMILDALVTTGQPVTGRCIPNPTQPRIQVDAAAQFLIDTVITWVDFSYNGPEVGLFLQPFNTVSEGVAATWLGGKIKIKAGNTTAQVLINKPMTITADGGNVSITAPGA